MFNMILGLSQTWDIPQDWYFNWEQIRWNMGVAYFQTNSFYFKYQPSKKKDKLNPTKKSDQVFFDLFRGLCYIQKWRLNQWFVSSTDSWLDLKNGGPMEAGGSTNNGQVSNHI